MSMFTDSQKSSLELIYGKKGPPANENNLFADVRADEKSVDYVKIPEVDDIPWDDLEDDPFAGSNVVQIGARNHRVTIMGDTLLPFPELYLRVFVQGPHWEQRAFRSMFARANCWYAETPETADLVVFTGGPDVNPIFYGEKPHNSTHFVAERDDTDVKLYAQCLKEGIPMFGVCRGMQFLHVMNGGKLYQDVDKHYAPHGMYDVRNKRFLTHISSVHHQACIANFRGGMELIASSRTSSKRILNPEQREEGTNHVDVEALWYRETACFGVQGHPEYAGYPEYTVWCLDQINELINQNPDLEWKGKTLRIKDSILNGPDVEPPAEDPKISPEAVPPSTRKPRAKKTDKENTVCAA